MHNSQDMAEAQLGKGRWMGKQDGAHTQGTILFRHKKGDSTLSSNKEGSRDDHIKWSK